MKLHRNHRHSGGHHEPRRRVTSTSHDLLADPGPDDFGLVQSWLNHVPLHDEVDDSVENFTHDTHNDYTSHWHPHNLPVGPIPPARHKFRHQRKRSLSNERPLVTTPDPVVGDEYSESQYETSHETGSDKENRKRPRPPSNRDSLDDLSHKPSFERRPRRKTRTDRYASKDQTGRRKSITKGETETSRKKGRSMKHQLRSSRDVMNNFESGAIPNTRVIMKPNLTTGLFLNGRSSTFGKVNDLTFNNMRFMETQSEVSKNDEEPLSDTDDECDHDKDETLDDSEQSLKQHVVISKTATCTTKAARDGEEEVRETHDERSNPRMQRSPSQGHESQGNCEASNEITRIHDSGATSVIFKKLMETGVFDGTGVLEKIAQQENQSNATGLEDLKILAKEWVSKHPAYEDKGVMVGAARNLPTRPDTRPPLNVTNHRPDVTNEVTKATDAPQHEYRGRELSLRTYDPKQGDLDPQLEPTQLPALAIQSTENDTNELSMNQNPTEAEEKQVSGVNDRRQSVSQTSEGGHHYIRCLDQEDRLGPAHQNHQGDLACVQRFFYQNTPLHLETQHIGQSLHHGWGLHDENMSPADLFHHQHLYQHVPMVLPMVFPEMHYTQHGKQDDNIPLAEPYDNHDDETMHEFIERIEDEAISKWDEPHQFLDAQCIGNAADLLEDEFSILPNEPNLLEDSDSELYRATDPIWDVLWPGHQSEPTIHDLQPSLGYRRNSDNQGYHSAGCIVGEPSGSEVEMPGFWRPNRF